MIRSINVKFSFLKSTYQDPPGTALSFKVCLSLKNSKRGRGSYNRINNQLTTSRSARSSLRTNVWLTCAVSNPSPLLSMIKALKYLLVLVLLDRLVFLPLLFVLVVHGGQGNLEGPGVRENQLGRGDLGIQGCLK